MHVNALSIFVHKPRSESRAPCPLNSRDWRMGQSKFTRLGNRFVILRQDVRVRPPLLRAASEREYVGLVGQVFGKEVAGICREVSAKISGSS